MILGPSGREHVSQNQYYLSLETKGHSKASKFQDSKTPRFHHFNFLRFKGSEISQDICPSSNISQQLIFIKIMDVLEFGNNLVYPNSRTRVPRVLQIRQS